MPRWSRLALLAVCSSHVVLGGEAPSPRPAADLPGRAEMAVVLRDVWGESALAQTGGPSYTFFKDLLPPSATRTPNSATT